MEREYSEWEDEDFLKPYATQGSKAEVWADEVVTVNLKVIELIKPTQLNPIEIEGTRP